MLQILSFTVLVFFLLVKKLTPEDKMNLDLDYFYRKGGRIFLWIDNRIIAPIDAFWGELYRTLGLRVLFGNAKASYAFDRNVIDGIVDGSAVTVRTVGFVVRKLQTGKIQVYIGMSLFIFFFIVWFIIMGR